MARRHSEHKSRSFDTHAVPISEGAAGTPTCAVVICAYTHHRWADTQRAIDSVRSQRPRPEELIVIVDHNPPLQRRFAEERPDLRIAGNHYERGLSGARNTGVDMTGADIIAFLDDDAEARPGWIAALSSHYTDPGVLGVGGRIDPDWATERPMWWPPEFDWVVGCSYQGQRPGPVRNLIGANASFRRELFNSGGFHPEIGRSSTARRPAGCEETEFCIRAARIRPDGFYLYDANAAVSHKVAPDRQTFSYFRSRCYSEGLSKAQVTRIVGAGAGLASERSYAAVTLPRGILRGLTQAARGQIAGLLRASVILIGLSYTTAGYIVGLISGPRLRLRNDRGAN